MTTANPDSDEGGMRPNAASGHVVWPMVAGVLAVYAAAVAGLFPGGYLGAHASALAVGYGVPYSYLWWHDRSR